MLSIHLTSADLYLSVVPDVLLHAAPVYFPDVLVQVPLPRELDRTLPTLEPEPKQ